MVHFVTLIVLLILAAVSLSAVFSDKGVFSKAESAGEKYNEAKAREVLEIVLMTDGQMEKHTNPKYNQDEFLDELIKSEIEGADVKGDIAIVGGYAYELDRSVPKIGRALGKADKLIFPAVEIISGPTLIDNGRKATFKVKATETTKGITRIELWLDGKRIEKETKTYDTAQTEITLDFEVNKNGKYTVKAYADLMASVTVEVIGIIPTVSFSPNGSTEWKKQHTTKVTVEETAETITGMKYLWVKDDNVNEPATSAFTQNCLNDGVVTGGDDTMTGTYYLWVLLNIGIGSNQKTIMCVSEGFNLDNEAPTVILDSKPVSETSFTLTATASDNKSGISRYEFYIDGVKVDTQPTKEGTASYIWNGTEMTEKKECYVQVIDTSGNVSKSETNARTKLYVWKKSVLLSPAEYKLREERKDSWFGGLTLYLYMDMPTLDLKTGNIITKGEPIHNTSWNEEFKSPMYFVWNNERIYRVTSVIKGSANYDVKWTKEIVKYPVYRRTTTSLF